MILFQPSLFMCVSMQAEDIWTASLELNTSSGSLHSGELPPSESLTQITISHFRSSTGTINIYFICDCLKGHGHMWRPVVCKIFQHHIAHT